MTNKKLFKSAVIITAVMLSVSGCAGGCSKQTEPVIADATVETPEPEESVESIESAEPTPSPTVEPTQESIDDTISSESEDNIESEEDTINEEDIQSEEVEPDLGYTIIAIDEVTMYATTNANLRSGPDTTYDIVGSLSYAQEITVNGKVESDGKVWYVLKNEDKTEMVSGSLLSTTKPQPKQTIPPSNENSQPSSGGQSSSSEDPGSVGMGEPGGMFSDLPEMGAGGIGSGGGTGLNWTTD